MNATTHRLTGVVSELPSRQPEIEAVYRELRELLTENDRLIGRNKTLKNRLDAALDRVAELEAGARPAWAAAPEPTQTGLELGRLRLNHDLRLLSLDGREAHVPRRMLEMLAYLMARPDRVIPSATLASALAHTNCNSVRTLMARIRARLAEIDAGRYLRTYDRSWAGGGYWMTAEGEAP